MKDFYSRLTKQLCDEAAKLLELPDVKTGDEPIWTLKLNVSRIEPHHVVMSRANLRTLLTMLCIRRVDASLPPPVVAGIQLFRQKPVRLLIHDLLLRLPVEAANLYADFQDEDPCSNLQCLLNELHVALHQIEHQQSLELGLLKPRSDATKVCWPPWE